MAGLAGTAKFWINIMARIQITVKAIYEFLFMVKPGFSIEAGQSLFVFIPGVQRVEQKNL